MFKSRFVFYLFSRFGIFLFDSGIFVGNHNMAPPRNGRKFPP